MSLGSVTNHYNQVASQTTYTFNNCDFGAEAADRLILVGVTGKINTQARTISGVTINGSAATELVQANTTVGVHDTPTGWYLLAVPTDDGGANGNVIAVTFSAGMARCMITVVRLTGTDSTPVDVGACASDGLSDTVNVVNGGYVIGLSDCGSASGPPAPTWTNVSAIFTDAASTAYSVAAADIGADGTLSPSVTWTASDDPATAFVSFAPAVISDGIAFSGFADGQVIQRQARENSKTVTVAGSYTGSPSAIEYRIVEDGTDTPISGHNWQTLDASPSGGAFSGDIDAPEGGWYNIDLRFAGGSDPLYGGTARWGVGALLFLIGQSNMVKMNTTVSSPPAANDLVSLYDGTWQAPAGNGCIALGNALVVALGLPVGLLMYAIGGTNVASWQAGQSSWTPAAAGLAAAGGDCEFVLWDQGERDALDGTAKATYKAGLANVYSQCRTATGRSASELPFIIALLGLITSPPVSTETDASWQAIQDGHLEFVAETAGAVIGNNRIDLAHTDQEHFTGAAYETMAARYAQTILNFLGLASYSGAGPRVSSATILGTTVTVRLAHDGGDDITPASGFTGFDVLVDGTPVTVSSAVRSAADSIGLELASPPSGTVTLRYQYGEAPNITGIVKDNSGLALPLLYVNGRAVTAPSSSAQRAVQKLATDLSMSF